MLTLTCALCKKRFINVAGLFLHVVARHGWSLPDKIKYDPKEDF